MELPIDQQRRNGYKRLRPDVPNRVVVAFDQLTNDERRRVLDALAAIERTGLDASDLDVRRLGGPLPLYALRVAPAVVVILRAEPGLPVEVRDIVQPATLDSFAHAR